MTDVSTAWLAGATVLTAGFLPCGWLAWRRRALHGLVALELAGALTTLALVCLAVGYRRTSYAVLPLLSAFLSQVSGLVYVRFLDRQP